MPTNSEYPAFVGSYLPMRVEQTVSFVPDGQLALPEKMSDDVRRAIAGKYGCKVCENIPDEDGVLEHGNGCYTQSEDGGGSEWICEYAEEIMRYERQQQSGLAWADWAIKPIIEAMGGWTVFGIAPHPIYAGGLVFYVRRGEEEKTVAIFQDGSNAPMQLDTGK